MGAGGGRGRGAGLGGNDTLLGAARGQAWATPQAHSTRGSNPPGITKIDIQAREMYPENPRYWPTPTVEGNNNRKGASAESGDGLATAVKQEPAERAWPSPLASDAEGGRTTKGKDRQTEAGLRGAVLSESPRATPRAEDAECAGAHRGKPDSLHSQTRAWPTPKAEPSGPDFARLGPPDSGGDDLATAVVKQWPTPGANDGKGGDADPVARRVQGHQVGLHDAVRGSWPTPTNSMATMADMEQARYAGTDPRRPSYAEAQQESARPTPAARDHRSGTGREENGHTPQLPEVLGGQLNPAWEEILMGYPEGWTDIGGPLPAARRNSRTSRRASPETSPTEPSA